jgi:hypothetical protein
VSRAPSGRGDVDCAVTATGPGCDVVAGNTSITAVIGLFILLWAATYKSFERDYNLVVRALHTSRCQQHERTRPLTGARCYCYPAEFPLHQHEVDLLQLLRAKGADFPDHRGAYLDLGRSGAAMIDVVITSMRTGRLRHSRLRNGRHQGLIDSV